VDETEEKEEEKKTIGKEIETARCCVCLYGNPAR
jgi:hypothetical protein